LILNNTRAEWYDLCPRRYFWAVEYDSIGLEPDKTDEKLLFGQIVHAGLASYYSGATESEVFDAVAAAGDSTLGLDSLGWDERNFWDDRMDLAQRLLRTYRPWAEEHDKFSVLQIETEGIVQLGEICWKCGEPYAGDEPNCPRCSAPIHSMVFRVDLTVNQEGRIGVIDHKTAKSASDLYLKSWHYSPQLLWYSYGYGKALETPANFYEVNIIRKLETAGTPQAEYKNCPECHNGKNKRLSCEPCGRTGKVEKEVKLVPFQREHEGVNPDNVERIVRSRISLCNEIEADKKLFETEPDAAFRMRPKSCFTYGPCPYLDLCWTGDPGKWYHPNPGLLMGRFKYRPDDYVDTAAMLREEQV